MNDLEDIIQIKIDFQRGSRDPQRVFDAMSDLIQSVQSLHSCLLHSIISDHKTELILSDIKEGSLVSWLLPEIRKDSFDISDNKKKKFRTFLNICTQKIIEFLEGKETISDSTEVDQLEKQIKKEAIDLEEFPNIFSLDRHRLVKGLSSIGKATEELNKEDQAYIRLPTGIFPINKNFNFSEVQAKQLLSEEIKIFHEEKTLIIKKPDFLGTSMWEFILAGRQVSVKILDVKWLDKFHHREKTVYPGDGLRCFYRVTISYDRIGQIIEEKYEILEVKYKVNTVIEQKDFNFDD